MIRIAHTNYTLNFKKNIFLKFYVQNKTASGRYEAESKIQFHKIDSTQHFSIGLKCNPIEQFSLKVE